MSKSVKLHLKHQLVQFSREFSYLSRMGGVSSLRRFSTL
jgi:hypothetical protein